MIHSELYNYFLYQMLLYHKDLIFTFEKTSLISVSVSGWLKCSVCVDLRGKKGKDTINKCIIFE
jgi:hypothetical protein